MTNHIRPETHKHMEKKHVCTLCKSNQIQVFLSLGPTPPANNFLEERHIDRGEKFYPLDVYFCLDCSHVGVLPRIDSEELFSDYVYLTSRSETMLSHLESLSDTIFDRYLDDEEEALVVDIGSNDGSLLQFFQEKGVNVVGVEPAENIAREARKNGVPTINDFFDEETAKLILEEYGLPDVVMATNVFAHIPELDEVTKGIELLLDEGGAFIFENAYLPDLIENKEFDTIYHEHLYYHSLTPLKSYFQRFGLGIADAERVPIHGGSIRVFVEKDPQISDRAKELIEFEEERGFTELQKYRDFAEEVKGIRQDLNSLIEELKRNNSRIAGYGAAAKGNTLLNYCRIGPEELDYVVDNTPLKQGKFTPGMHIPVKTPRHFRNDYPDYVLLLAWNFAREIIAKEKEFLEQGGKFIIPVPEVKVVGKEFLEKT